MSTTHDHIAQYWEYADATLKALRDRGLRPTPELYHVWFIYYADDNPEILRVINAVKAGGEELDEETLLQLYYRYIFDRQAADFLQRGMEDFFHLIENSDDCLTTARADMRLTTVEKMHFQLDPKTTSRPSPTRYKPTNCLKRSLKLKSTMPLVSKV